MEKLFKIKPIDGRNIADIENNRIWVPKVSDLNDPYDCGILPYLGSDFELDELDQLIHELMNESELFGQLFNVEYYKYKDKAERNYYVHKFICEQIRSVGICSFLDSPFNIVTWSHYGNNHRGMCLEYSRVDDELARFTAIGKGYRLHNVSYVNIAPRYEWKDFMRVPELTLRLCLTTKFKDWDYENEIRLITYYHQGGLAIDCDSLGLKLDRIYIGCMAEPSEERSKLENVCELKGIDVVKLDRAEFSYRLLHEH